MKDLEFVYFGGEPLGVPVLEALAGAGFLPSLVVANPDRPAGRGKQLTPPPVKVWAQERDIEVWQPTNFSDEAAVRAKLAEFNLFIVVAYNHIMPEWLIAMPEHNTLNLHPSLLPKYRGCNPIRTAIVNNDKNTGVSIIKLDTKMDHGPIVAQEPIEIAESEWPLPGSELDSRLASLGGTLLASILPSWINGKIEPLSQEHDQATFTKRMNKADGELKIDPHNLPTGKEAYQALLKIRAYDGFPGTFFMYGDQRIKISGATISPDGQLTIPKITPAGKKETDFNSYF